MPLKPLWMPTTARRRDHLGYTLSYMAYWELMALRCIECSAKMLEYLGSKKGEGGGADPSVMSDTCIFICG